MKSLFLSLAGAVALAWPVSAQVVSESVVVGNDGPCVVYFQNGYGYYEVCSDQSPVFLGVHFEGAHFHHGFRFHEGFHRDHYPGHPGFRGHERHR